MHFKRVYLTLDKREITFDGPVSLVKLSFFVNLNELLGVRDVRIFGQFLHQFV